MFNNWFHSQKPILIKLVFFITLFTTFVFHDALAESVTIDIGTNEGSMSGRLIQLFIIVSVLSLAPSIVIMATSFTRIVVVFSVLRNAIGLQQSPPNVVLVSLALFLTAFVMGPAFEKSFSEGVSPLMNEKIGFEEAYTKTVAPLHQFMVNNVREKDLTLITNLSREKKVAKPSDIPLKILLPSFMISELRKAFEIGFLVFVPFLVIDMIVASVLMSMGMMMLPPAMISLPFKLVFFVLIDGWHLLAGSLINSFHS